MMKLLSLDPGITTGWALFNTINSLPLIKFGSERGKDTLWCALEELKQPELVVVVEDYINRPSKAGGFDHAWDTGKTHRIIGSIEHWCWENHYKFILQQPMIKPAAYGMLGLKYEKGKKNQHHLDAIVHGYYFLLAQKLVDKKKIFLSLKGGNIGGD